MGDLFNNPLFVIELCGGFLGMCIGPIFTALIFYFWYSVNFKKANGWKEFSNKYGFSYTSPNPLLREYGSMSGKFEGREVSIFSKSINRSPAITIVKLKVGNTGNFFLSVGEKGMFGNFYRTTGGSDVPVEKDFDEKLSTNSNSPELATIILHADAGLLAEIKTLMPLELLVRDNSTSISTRGNYADETQLLRLIRLVLRFATILEENLRQADLLCKR
ncbi:MAG: hypothetical protein JNM55_20260 [Anaerolineales bacterium]|nr:hypothetical protein [Anaerolineales bacterium]